MALCPALERARQEKEEAEERARQEEIRRGLPTFGNAAPDRAQGARRGGTAEGARPTAGRARGRGWRYVLHWSAPGRRRKRRRSAPARRRSGAVSPHLGTRRRIERKERAAEERLKELDRPRAVHGGG